MNRSTWVLLYAMLAITLWNYIPEAPRLLKMESGRSFISSPTENAAEMTECEKGIALLRNSQRFWGTFLLFGLIPMGIVRFGFREKLSDYGVCWGNRYTLRSFLIMAPVMIAIGWFSGHTTEFYAVYPYNPWFLGGATSLAEGWMFSIFYNLLYFFLYYFSWEFFFRGFLQRAMEPSLGVVNTILLQTTLSVFAHFTHPSHEALGAIAGGLIWGFLVYRTRSILSGWGQHAAIGMALDYGLIYYAQ
ncbi:MAG: type II CAAX endopeptidase family protein [Planctomycetia bacterium]|nr:type II CAAX endopeptidase family protein [Planctomycetia bacterium]